MIFICDFPIDLGVPLYMRLELGAFRGLRTITSFIWQGKHRWDESVRKTCIYIQDYSLLPGWLSLRYKFVLALAERAVDFPHYSVSNNISDSWLVYNSPSKVDTGSKATININSFLNIFNVTNRLSLIIKPHCFASWICYPSSGETMEPAI
jgi:hypothetical protein